MNGRTVLLRLAMVLVGLAMSTGEIAGQAATRFDPPKRYYLALGDSLAFGFQFLKLSRSQSSRRSPSLPSTWRYVCHRARSDGISGR